MDDSLRPDSMNVEVFRYDGEISHIDIHEGHIPGRTSAYVIKGSKNILIETGSSICQPYLLNGLNQLNLSPADIDYIIVTHIHLDHSGGVGKLLPLMPRAQVIVHPRGARHLIDPSRLLAGAHAAYGNQLHELFGDVLPVPAERVTIRQDGERLDIGDGRSLVFIDTPGHARHHFSIWDEKTRSVFCGDTFGIRYIPRITGWDFIEVYPSTSPSEFDPDAVIASIEKVARLNPRYLYHSHFGRSDDPDQVFQRIAKIVVDYDQIGRKLTEPDLSWETLADGIRQYVRNDLRSSDHPTDIPLDGLELDIELNAKGILHRIISNNERP